VSRKIEKAVTYRPVDTDIPKRSCTSAKVSSSDRAVFEIDSSAPSPKLEMENKVSNVIDEKLRRAQKRTEKKKTIDSVPRRSDDLYGFVRERTSEEK